MLSQSFARPQRRSRGPPLVMLPILMVVGVVAAHERKESSTGGRGYSPRDGRFIGSADRLHPAEYDSHLLETLYGVDYPARGTIPGLESGSNGVKLGHYRSIQGLNRTSNGEDRHGLDGAAQFGWDGMPSADTPLGYRPSDPYLVHGAYGGTVGTGVAASDVMSDMLTGDTGRSESGAWAYSAEMAPRSERVVHSSFETSYRIIQEPSTRDLMRCIMHVTVEQLSDNKTQSLKSGSVVVQGNPFHQLIKMTGVSVVRYTSKSPVSIIRTFLERCKGELVKYETVFPILEGCVYNYLDPNAIQLVRRDRDYVVDVLVRLSPEVYAVYNTSKSPIPVRPADIGFLGPGVSKFVEVGPCIYAAHYDVAPSTVKVLASTVRVTVSVRDKSVTEDLTLDFPADCFPVKHNRIATWITPSPTGSLIIVATRPLRRRRTPEDQWETIPAATNEASFSDHPYVHVD